MEAEDNYVEYDDVNEGPRYAALADIDSMGLYKGLAQLDLLTDDMYLSVQASNLGMVDIFLTELEYQVLRDYFENDRTPPETHMLSALSQMWILAIYEVLRTWRQRVKDIMKWANNGGLEMKLKAMRERDYSYKHFGHELRVEQLERVGGDPNILLRVEKQLRHIHIPFARLEHVRIAIAKHEVAGKAGSAALMPGYGRINNWCGSLDYELENGHYIIGLISRRDIANSFRELDCSTEPPTPEELKDFDAYMSGKGFQQP